MFSELVSTLTLDKTRIIYPNFSINHLDIRKIMVGDLFKPWDTNGNHTYPDYYIRGHYYNEDHYSKNIFRIDEYGPDIMYITGVPKNYNIGIDNFKYPYPYAKYMTYFEDSEIGYLIQIVKGYGKNDPT